MRVEAGIGEADEPFVEPFLVGTALVPTHEKDRLPTRVEGEGDAPLRLSPTRLVSGPDRLCRNCVLVRRGSELASVASY